MADVVSRKVRSRMMAGIRGKDTKPELLIRSELHKRGFRFRIHVKALPGKPDIVLRKWNAVVFVHGCFWHKHDCHLFKLPSTRRDWWRQKLSRNRLLDSRNRRALQRLGWRVLSIYECAIRGKESLQSTELIGLATKWLRGPETSAEIRGRKRQNRPFS